MADRTERACTRCGSLLHHEDRCPDVRASTSPGAPTWPAWWGPMPASPGAETGGGDVRSALRALLEEVRHVPGLSSAGAAGLLGAARTAARALDSADRAPGAETVEQRVLSLVEEMEREASGPMMMLANTCAAASALRKYAGAFRALLAASSGKTGEPASAWRRERAVERIRSGEPFYAWIDAHPAVIAYRTGSAIRILTVRILEDWTEPAPVSQGPEKPRVVARPDLETCAHGLRRADCEWCVYSGTQPAPGPEREEPRCGPNCKDGRHEFGCAKWVPPPACTCKMPIGFGRSFKGFMAPDPKCPRCHPAPSPASTPEPEKGGRS